MKRKHRHSTKGAYITYDQPLTSSKKNVPFDFSSLQVRRSAKPEPLPKRRAPQNGGLATTANRRGQSLRWCNLPKDKNKVSSFATLLRELHRIVDWTCSETLFVCSVSHIFVVLCSQGGAQPWPAAADRPGTGRCHHNKASHSATCM